MTVRGSEFSLCQRSRADPAYSRYPRVPVSDCRGFEHGSPPKALSGEAAER